MTNIVNTEARKPIAITGNYGACPRCGNLVSRPDDCKLCGQAIKWTSTEEHHEHHRRRSYTRRK